MPKFAINFIQKRKLEFPRRFMNFFAFRASPSILMGAFLVLAGLGAGVFYLMKFQGVGPFAEKPKSQALVAGATCVPGKLPQEWLLKYFNTDNECDPKVGGAEGDPDTDGLPNLEELAFDTGPANPDTDGDGVYDGSEVAFNKNPKGEGYLQVSQQTAEDYLKSLGPEYERFSEVNIEKELANLFQPDKGVVLELPEDGELVVMYKNDEEAFKKYYEATKDLGATEEQEIATIQNSLFELNPEELEHYIAKLQATIQVLKETPVPSEIINIHKFKIAGLRAGIRIFELIRDNYQPDSANHQFWSDFFAQAVLVQQAEAMEVLAWQTLEDNLQESGDL